MDEPAGTAKGEVAGSVDAYLPKQKSRQLRWPMTLPILSFDARSEGIQIFELRHAEYAGAEHGG
jgi:hypothetical protein